LTAPYDDDDDVATRCQILRLKCSKFDFGWGSAPDPAGGAYSAPPDSLAGFKGPTSKGREGEWEGKGGTGGEGSGGEGPSCLSVAPWLRKLDPPLAYINVTDRRTNGRTT